MAALKCQVPPHWNRHSGGRERLVLELFFASSIIVRFQSLSICVRTSAPFCSNTSNINSRLSVREPPPVKSSFGTFFPTIGLACHVFDLASVYSVGLNRHSILS